MKASQRRNYDNYLLVETTATEIVGDDDVRHSVENKLDILRIGGTRHVTVDFFGGRLVFGFKLSLDVSSSFAILLCTCNKVSISLARLGDLGGPELSRVLTSF